VDFTFGDFTVPVTFNGGGGLDTSVTMSRAATAQQAALRTDAVQLGGAIALTLGDVETSYFYGQPDDSALLFDSARTDFFVSDGTYAYVAGLNDGTFRLASGVGFVYGYSSGQDGDNAWHYDTPGTDSFVASGTAYSYMSGNMAGQSFFNVGVGFAVNYGYSTEGGADYAYFLDSPNNDTFYSQDDASGDYAYMSGSRFFSLGQQFERISGQSFVGGSDTAYNYAPHKTALTGFATVFTQDEEDDGTSSSSTSSFGTNTAWRPAEEQENEDDLSALDEVMSDDESLGGLLS
ncbi:MAG: hypothetical protein ACREJB_14325, partial [Planctomycetaceae bacterium]